MESFSLVIFELVPESVEMYQIPNSIISGTDRELLQEASGQYINSDEDVEAVSYVQDYLAEKVNYCRDEEQPSNCKWNQYRVKGFKLEDISISHVYIMGACI